MARTIAFNGVNGATGAYLLSVPPSAIARAALGVRIDKVVRAQAEERLQRAAEHGFAPIAGVDPAKLDEAGWGVVFPAQGGRAADAELQPLIDLRREQAGATVPGRFRVFMGGEGYRPGESGRAFLERHGADPFGPADPDVLPYYLLLAGDADEIPFSFQYDLAVQRAVGRVAFRTGEAYAHYAASVVAAESAATSPKTAVFAGVRNADDEATRLSSTTLVSPLAKKLARQKPEWAPGIRELLGDATTKPALRSMLSGEDRASFVFTASHGLGFPRGDPLQADAQGALLCAEWPGPTAWRKPVPPEFYVAAADLPADADLGGAIVFHFACYGAGTPDIDAFARIETGEQVQLADRPFVAALPQRLLERGALAVIGHVDRAWGFSFTWRGNPHLDTFVSTIRRLMEGARVGDAFDYFSLRHLSLARAWSEEVMAIEQFGVDVVPLKLARLWSAERDARSYVVLGDPAVRLNA